MQSSFTWHTHNGWNVEYTVADIVAPRLLEDKVLSQASCLTDVRTLLCEGCRRNRPCSCILTVTSPRLVGRLVAVSSHLKSIASTGITLETTHETP